MLKLYEGYTAARLPVKLVGAQTFYTRDEAFAAERKVKKWARVKKEAFIKSNWNELSKLAKKVFKGSHESLDTISRKSSKSLETSGNK